MKFISDKIHIALLLALLLSPQTLWAGGGEEGVPLKLVVVQAGNLILLVGLLVYFSRKKIQGHFSARRSNFQELVGKAERARAEAERANQTIAEKLRTLESKAEDDKREAVRTAEELKSRLQSEAQDLARRLNEDAKKTAALEIEKAKEKLRAELLDEAIKTARAALRDTVGEPEQKRLQTEFVEKIQVAR